MESVEQIVLAAWNGTKPFYASSPNERFKYMLEFLMCNGIGTESDDDQAAVIRACRQVASAPPAGYIVVLVEPDRRHAWGATVHATADGANDACAIDQEAHFSDMPGVLKVYEIREVQ